MASIQESNELIEIRDRLQNEVQGNRLNCEEVPAKDFITWYQWMLRNAPIIQPSGESIENFDIESVLGMFEGWVVLNGRTPGAIRT